MIDEKVVLVTGAAKRIGACIVETFHANGYLVIIHYNRSVVEANALVDRLNKKRASSAICLQADLNDQEAIDLLASETLTCYQRLDVLVNNASTYYATPFGTATRRQWDDLQNSNLSGAFFLIQALSQELVIRNGSIVNIVDTYADRPLHHHSVYSIAKASLKAMTKALAIELAPKVRVNGVAPGAILWPATLENGNDPQVIQARAKVQKKIPLGTLGQLQDIADATYFLASDANYVTGQVIKVDGGRSLS